MDLFTGCFKIKEKKYKAVYNNEENDNILYEKIKLLEKENENLKEENNFHLKKNLKKPVGRPKKLEWINMTEKQKYRRTYNDIRKKRVIKHENH